MSKGLIDLLVDRIFDEAWVGRRGEKLTERELKLVQLFGRKGKVLRNVIITVRNQIFRWLRCTKACTLL